ncbi:MAG: hypothetical protein RJB61_42 [Actinomycetota bacterium]
MSAQAWFDEQHYEVAPGGSLVARLTVRNLGTTSGSFSITPLGLPATFATVTPAVVTLFPNEQASVEVELRPPLSPTTTAGLTSLAVRIVPHENPDFVALAETGIEIAEFIEQRMNIVQPVLRGRRRADFEVTIENNGNRATSLRLHYLEPTGRTEAAFDPPSLVVEPGTMGLAVVRVRSLSFRRQRTARAIPFRVQASDMGVTALDVSGTFVHTPLLPERALVSALGALGALGIVSLLWFAIVKGAVTDTARDAVRGLVPAESTGSTGTLPPSSGSSGTPTAVAGELISGRLTSTPAPGETQTAAFTVPDGLELRITDVVLQNPQLDLGTVSISRDGQVLLAYNLENVFADAVTSFATPLAIPAGVDLVVSITCDAVGDPEAETCAAAVTFSGTLVG